MSTKVKDKTLILVKDKKKSIMKETLDELKKMVQEIKKQKQVA